MSLTEIRRAAAGLSARLERAKDKVANEKAQLEKAAEVYAHEQSAQQIIQSVAQTVQQQAHDRIAAVVSRCLTAVFEQPYVFSIRFERKRGKTEAVLTFLRDGNEVSPTFGSEGGVLDVAAFALRLACMSLTQPPLRKLLVLDEPARSIHGEGNRERFRELLESLPKELGVQIVFVTGLDWLTCGKVIKL